MKLAVLPDRGEGLKHHRPTVAGVAGYVPTVEQDCPGIARNEPVDDPKQR